MNIREVEQDATKKQNGRVEGNLAVGGGTFGVRLCDQHEAMAGITSSSDMYLLLIMICNRQRCASLYSTVDSAMWRLRTTSRVSREESKRLPVCIPRYCTSEILCPTNPGNVPHRLIRANGRESRGTRQPLNPTSTTSSAISSDRKLSRQDQYRVPGYPGDSKPAPWCRRHTLSLNLVTWEVAKEESVLLNTLIPTCRNRAASLFRSVAGSSACTVFTH